MKTSTKTKEHPARYKHKHLVEKQHRGVHMHWSWFTIWTY